jgi:hypothetical protein
MQDVKQITYRIKVNIHLCKKLLTFFLNMVLKWLFRNNTASSSWPMAAFSSQSPWYVSCEAVRSRNCSAIRAGRTESKYNSLIPELYI